MNDTWIRVTPECPLAYGTGPFAESAYRMHGGIHRVAPSVGKRRPSFRDGSGRLAEPK